MARWHFGTGRTRTNRLGTPVTAYVAHEAPGVLQARHAQMDERAPEAPQKRASEKQEAKPHPPRCSRHSTIPSLPTQSRSPRWRRRLRLHCSRRQHRTRRLSLRRCSHGSRQMEMWQNDAVGGAEGDAVGAAMTLPQSNRHRRPSPSMAVQGLQLHHYPQLRRRRSVLPKA